jgi:rubredoxin
MFVEYKAFKCTKCGKVYENEAPPSCVCEISLQPGKIVGTFQLLAKMEDRNWNVICLLCGLETKINSSNMKRQKSCGCKPRHIDLIDMSADSARYKCRKCRTSYTEETPILLWCCTEEED